MIVRPVVCRPFVGRCEELAYLHERRLEAGSSHGGLVLIAGDAGVGKSRFISHFCSSLARSRWRIAAGQCDAGASRPFGPVLEILARLDGAPFELGGAATKREQQHAILVHFAALAASRALVIVIEDAHWADAATLDFLAFLGQELGRMRVLVLVSFRPGDVDHDHAEANLLSKIERNAQAARVDLAPLRGLELRTFIDGALDGIALPPKTLREIALAGEGNPFFTEELLKSAVEATSTDRSASRRRNVPQTVRATVLERLRDFDERERDIVAQAAVIGRTFGIELLASTLETTPHSLLSTLRRARDVQLVEELTPSTFRFRHGLTRDAIYGDFLRAELPPRHRAIALALESGDADGRSLEALAFHWWAAADAARSARYNEAAGDAAGRVHAHEDAIVLYERALESPDLDARTRGSITEKIALRRAALDRLSEARDLYSAAAEIFRAAGDHAREAASRSAAAIFAYQTNVADPTEPLEQMLARLGPDDALARSRAHLGIAWITATLWLPTETARHIAQVDERARAEALDIRLRYHNVSAWVAMTIGDLDTFRHEYAAWLTAAEALGSEHTLSGVFCNGGMCLSFFGRHEEARSQLDRGLQIARAAHLVNSEEAVHAVRVMSELLHGNLKGARAALELVRPSSESHFVRTAAMSWGSIVAAHLDDRNLIERWFDAFEATIKPDAMLECAGGFAEIMVRRGRASEAADLLHRAIPDCEVIRGNLYSLLAVARYGFVADRPRARAYLERAAEGRDDVPERPALALFDALVHRHDGHTSEAVALANDAAAGFRRLGMPLFEAAACEVAGDVSAALALFRACGATYDIRRLDRDPVVAPELSPRERDVALLASDGLSNLEIARKLAITSKTVEKHLASVYRKLDITSRRRLSAVVHARGDTLEATGL